MNEQDTGRRISQARKEKDWTQKDLAERLHISTAAVSKWERGLNYPDLSLLQPLARELGVPAAELLGLENETAETAVLTVTQISANEKQKKTRQIRVKLLLLLGLLFAGIVISAVICIIGSSDRTIPSIGFMEKLFHTGMLNLASICLGLCAWGFGIASLFTAKKTYTAFSFLFCALSVYLPTLITDLQVRFGDYAALEDTIWGYDFAAIVLLLGTVLLNSMTFVHIFRREVKKKQKNPPAPQTEQ